MEDKSFQFPYQSHRGRPKAHGHLSSAPFHVLMREPGLVLREQVI